MNKSPKRKPTRKQLRGAAQLQSYTALTYGCVMMSEPAPVTKTIKR